MKIVKNLVPQNKYNIKCPYSMKPTRIVVHNTANDASAKNEIAYMIRNDYETSFHYAVDDVGVVQGIEENRNAWHASDGNGKGNREGIAIEICYSKSGGDKFIKAEQNAVELIVDILKRYGWGVDKVTKHQDYTNKYCPHRTLDMGWDRFIKMINDKLNPPASAKIYNVVTPINKYVSSSDAKAKKNSKGKFAAGTYYIFNKYPNGYNGMYNITTDKTGNSAGSWINPAENVVAAVAPKIEVGSTVMVNKGAKTYTGGNLASFVYSRKHKVKQISGDRVVITYLGIVVAAVKLSDLTLV